MISTVVPYARARALPKGAMNKTEAAYAQHLELQKKAGELRDWGFERYKLKLANNTYYTPDFYVLEEDWTISFHEVKGFWRDDARVKIKVAAEQYPWHRFVAVKRVKGGWGFEEF